jgi:uncharacterized repeat protein (TIGR01451 family)
VLALPARGDYVGSLINRIFVDPASIPVIEDGVQNGDVISYILETTPADTGSDFGHAAWMTLYVPPGVEVVGAEFVLPAGNGGYDRLPAEDTDTTYDGWGARGSEGYTPDTGATQLGEGYVNEVQQDTGIFYSTDPRTRVIPGSTLLVDPTGVAQQTVYNLWDFDQTQAFGEGFINGGQGNTPLLGTGCTGNDGVGCTWTGVGSIVAGPDTYYTNDYDPNCSVSTAFEDDASCVGPWQRIAYENSKLGGSNSPEKCRPGNSCPAPDPFEPDPTILFPAYDTGEIRNTGQPLCADPLDVTTCVGLQISPASPLPETTATTGANALRWVHGARRLGELETARVTFRVTDAVAFTASFADETFCLDSTGGDTSDTAAKDNPFRYYEPQHACDFVSASGNLFKQIRYVNGELNNGASLSVGDILGFEITLTNTSGDTLTSIDLSDTPDTNDLTLLEPGGSPLCPYPSYDGDLPGPSYDAGSATLGTATWAQIPSLLATESVTVLLCAEVTGGGLNDRIGNTATASLLLPDLTPVTLTSTATGTISTYLAGHVFADPDGSGDLTPGDAGFAGVTVELYDNDGDTLFEPTIDVIDGLTDLDGDGDVDVYDDGIIDGVRVIDGQLDITGDGVIDSADDGLFRGVGVIDGVLDLDGDATPGEPVEDSGTLVGDDGDPFATTTTLSDGSYSFAGIPGGDYFVREIDPEEWTSTGDLDTPAGGCDSGNGCNVIAASVPNGGSSTGNDFFDQPPPAGVNTITGTTFLDADENALYDPGAGDSGQGGITVELYRDENGNGVVDVGDTLLQTTVSADDGSYGFTVVEEGDFVVATDTSSFPPGQSLTTDNIETASFVGFGNTDADNDFGLSGGVGTTGGVCYAVADSVDQLVAYTIATMSFNDVGPTGTTAIEAIAYQFGTNVLFAANGGTFGTLNQGTGAFTAIGPFGSCTLPDSTVINVTDVDALSFDPFTGILWGAHRDGDGTAPDDVLVTIDPTTGQVAANCVRIGATAVVGLPDIDDISVSPVDQTMYAIANNGGSGDGLVIVDTLTGSVTDVGPTGVADIEGLGFANDGSLYGTDGNGAPNGDLYSIDLSSGAATQIFSLPLYGDYESVDCMTAGANLVLDGTVFADQNQNGAHDPDLGEIGQEDVTVYLYRDVNNDGLVDAGDVLIQTAVTDSNGDYGFTLGTDGSFAITTDFPGTYPAGAVLTTDNVEEADFIGFNQSDTGNDFGFIIPGTLEIEKVSDTGGATFAGDTITYTLSPRSPSSSPLVNAAVTDALPADTAFVVATPTQDSGPDPLLWQLGSTTAGISGVEQGVFTCGALADLPSTADTFIEEDDQTADNGGADPLLTRPQPVGSINRALYRFDLSSLPAGATVTNARLFLTSRNSRSDHLANLHRVTSSWTEVANWTTPWASPGGDFDAAVLGTFVPNQSRQAVNVTPVVQGWVAGTFANHGFLLDPNGSDAGDAQWASRDDGTTERQPLLRVGYEYTSPGGCPATVQAPADRDTYIEEDDQAADNSGADKLLTRPQPAGSINRTLYRFDLSAIPAGAIIDSALLTVTSRNSRSSHLANVYRVTTDWAETANWNVPWTSAGGDFDTGTLLGTFTPDQTQQQIDIAALAQQWVNGTTPNYGVILDPTGTDGGDAEWASREDGTASRQPFIEISYRSPTVDVTLPVTGDTYIEQDDQSADNGTNDPVLTRPQPAGSINRALFQFETAALPGSATVVSATLNVNSANSRSNHLANVRHATTSWTEVANWTTTDGVTPWTTAGGDFAGAYGSLTPVGGNVFEQADVTSLVQDWADGTLAPYGVVLDPSGSDAGDAQWNSREDGDPTRHAFVAVRYTAAGSTIERTSTLTAAYSLVTGGDSFDLTLVLEATGDVTNVLPGTLDSAGTNGAGATCTPSSPVTVPGTFDPQDVSAGSPATFIWSCTASAGATPGSLTFDVDANGSESFATTSANSVLVSPPLTFQVTVDSPLDPDTTLVANTATLTSDLTTPASDTVIDPLVRGTVGDRIWLDTDGDGVQDIGEEGIANVEVSIYSVGADGVPGGGDDLLVATTTTDANGSYLFANLPPATYYIDVTDSSVPSGLVLAPGSLDAPSEPIATLPTYTVTSSEVYLDADIGYTAPADSAIVGDRVWSDADQDGVQDPGEPGIGGVTVNLVSAGPDGVFGTADDVVEDSTATAEDGSYLFTGVSAGEYVVVLDSSNFTAGGPLEGYSATTGPQSQGSGRSDPLTVDDSDVWVDADFGYFKAGLGSIGDQVWLDADADGTYEPGNGEAGIEGVTVDLIIDINEDFAWDPDGVDDIAGTADDELIIATAVTGADGAYLFTGLELDQGLGDAYYILTVSDTAGVLTNYGLTSGLAGIDDESQTDPYPVELTPVATENLTADFGFNGPSSVGQVLWIDSDGDGAKSDSELGIAGVTVDLIGPGPDGLFGTADDEVLATTLTDEAGDYLFAGLPPGDYMIDVTDTGGVLATLGLTLTSDPDGVLDGESEVSLLTDASDLTVNFGYQNAAIADISGTVFLDADQDAVLDGGESGIGTVTVALVDATGNVVATTTTASDGSYVFADVPPGDYTVRVTDDRGALDGYQSSLGIDELPVTVGATDVTGIDFGYSQDPATGSIGDTVWLDANGDGIRSGSEAGITGVTLDLIDVGPDGILGTADDVGVVASTVTDADGDYVFADLAAGNYVVDVTDAGGELTGLALTVGSTDPSATVALSEGEVYSEADFGFVPAAGTAVLGDRVWYDTDGNGLQDAGEVGIAGIEIQILGTSPGSSCNPVPCTVTTDPDGSWLATGLVPGDYLVSYDETKLPAGYGPAPTNNGGDTTYNIAVMAGDSLTHLDYGFNGGTTHVLSDRVWLDADGDGLQDSGEAGIGGVTLNLVDASGNVVATTVTGDGTADANGDMVIDAADIGYYEFTGVPAGTFTVEVTDLAGVLVSLQQTGDPDEPGAPCAACDRQYTAVVGPDLDTVDFGFSPAAGTGVIGDFIWRDLNGDGAQDVGEPGVEGVTVELWVDVDSDGVLTPGVDNLVRTEVTDVNGLYEFKGLPDGDYIVRVTDTNGVLTGLSQTADPDEPGVCAVCDGEATVPLAGGNSDFTSDFGYEAPADLSISGTVFEDENMDTTFDDGVEPEVESAVARLYRYDDLNGDGDPDPGEPFYLFDTTTTDANGDYTFTDLAAGTYFVEVDTSGTAVDGYLQTTQAGTEGVQPVELVAASSTGNDFGYWNGGVTTTPVTLAYFEATGGGGSVSFRWTTSTEVGNLGFNLWALGETGLEKLNRELIPSHAIDSIEPQRYEYESSGVPASEFVLEDVDIFGVSRFHGPFELGSAGGNAEVEARAIDWQSIRSEHMAKRKARLAKRAAKARGPLAGLTRSPGTRRTRRFPVAEIEVPTDGIYRVRHEDLIAAGIDLTGMPSRHLVLRSGGEAVPMRVVGADRFWAPGAFIEFVGQGLETLYTKANVYRLQVGRGAGLRAGQDPTRAPSWVRAEAFYFETETFEDNRAYHFASPSGDPWYDAWLLAVSDPVETTREFTLDHHAEGAGDLSIEVSMWGVTDFPQNPDHHVRIEVNGVEVGDEIFDGLVDQTVTLAVPDSALEPGANSLRIELPHDTGAEYDLVAFDSYSVTYPRRFVARADTLRFRAAGDAFEVGGLSSSSVEVYRQTASGVDRLSRVEVTGVPGDYAARFAGTAEEDEYFVSTVASIAIPSIEPARESVDLVGGLADFLIISHPDFVTEIEPLARARRAEGYSVRVVDVEDIYSQFHYGVFDPRAIRGYLSYAYEHMGTRFALLVGGDTYDYHDYLEQGAVSFIPSLYAQTDEIVKFAPVDPLFGDVDLDGVPEIAVGRLPVRDSAELANVIQKTLDYRSASYAGTAIVAADTVDVTSGYSFTEASNELLALLPAGWSVETTYLDDTPLQTAQDELVAAINGGVALTSYFGHSGPSVWSFQGLFDSADAAALDNRGRPTVVTQWGCWNTYYVSPTSDTMGHELLLAGEQGAAAVLGASTLTEAESERKLGRLIFEQLGLGKPLGKAVVDAKRKLAQTDPDLLDVLLGWTLLGDPTLRVRP